MPAANSGCGLFCSSVTALSSRTTFRARYIETRSIARTLIPFNRSKWMNPPRPIKTKMSHVPSRIPASIFSATISFSSLRSSHLTGGRSNGFQAASRVSRDIPRLCTKRSLAFRRAKQAARRPSFPLSMLSYSGRNSQGA